MAPDRPRIHLLLVPVALLSVLALVGCQSKPPAPQDGAAPAQEVPEEPAETEEMEPPSNVPDEVLVEAMETDHGDATYDRGQSGFMDIDAMMPPEGETKDRNKAVADAEPEALLAVYRIDGLSYAGVTAFIFQDAQSATAAMDKLAGTMERDTAGATKKVSFTANDTSFTGYSVESLPGTVDATSFGASTNIGLMIRLVGEDKIADEKTAAELMSDIVSQLEAA